MDLEFELIETGLISAEQYVEAIKHRREERIPLGQIGLEMGLLTPQQVREILLEQGKQQRPKRFGEVAISFGYLTQQELAELLLEQSTRERPIVQHLVEAGAVTPEQIHEVITPA